MTVAELIEELKKHPSDMSVLLWQGDGKNVVAAKAIRGRKNIFTHIDELDKTCYCHIVPCTIHRVKDFRDDRS